MYMQTMLRVISETSGHIDAVKVWTELYCNCRDWHKNFVWVRMHFKIMTVSSVNVVKRKEKCKDAFWYQNGEYENSIKGDCFTL